MSSRIAFVTSERLSRIPKLRHGMTQRFGGISRGPYESLNLGLHVEDYKQHVVENRRRACRALGFPLASWVGAEQVHGVHVARVTSRHRGSGAFEHATAIPKADGLITNEADVLLTSFFADCVPIVVYDPQERSIGMAHAGWRGTVGRIAGKLVHAMQHEFSCDPAALYVWIGPSIGPCCYVVGSELAQRVADAFGSNFVPFDVSRQQHTLDLPALNKALLQQAGVKEEHIELAGQCTQCQTDTFFSHRASGGKTGRMACFIGLTK